MDLVYKYSNYYYRNLCSEGCPINTKCQWGFCVCNEGTELILKKIKDKILVINIQGIPLLFWKVVRSIKV